ncbi:hypothetical protein BKA82DRAFT_25873 [Pisolithus tinctorius]|uniref:Uncharacterized protein n=1 Tax=Pisolithus tinctorius Marx 270 TaxID=870435 RepID=A0A0C3NV59_PISTI|nr:hypothetical protein BKA82DRAFT_25873 [Pisolithus tinctorius]KIO04760.1 hypothetical protein M404DRAFT_25873 [Pisolithus tinctorius Marx 270]
MAVCGYKHFSPCTAPYVIWTFLVGKTSCPRMMWIRPERNYDISITKDQIIFPADTVITSKSFDVEGRHYHVFFDADCDHRDRKNTTYVFVRLLRNGKAIDICAEDDLPDILVLLSQYVVCLMSASIHPKVPSLSRM